ncbi:hypothetical protein GQ457_05G029110 [Hibiscus cannabinus]
MGEGSVNVDVGGCTGGRPPDSVPVNGSLPMVEDEVMMTDPLVAGKQAVLGVQFERSHALSFKEKLLGNSGQMRASAPIAELDVEVLAEDVRIGGASEMPEIWFSDHVHDAINAKLTKSMIIRLLGKSIGYRALWNRIMALWNPLVKSTLLIWITNTTWCALRIRMIFISGSVQTPFSGIVIDGKRQDIEYEGLPSICFKCVKYGHAREVCGISEIVPVDGEDTVETRNPEDLYGPWMQVGLRYAALSPNDSGRTEDVVELHSLHDGQERRDLSREVRVSDTVRAHESQDGAGRTVAAQRKQHATLGKSTGFENNVGKFVADRGSPGVVVEGSSLNSEKHVVVHVGGTEEPWANKVSKGRVLPASIKLLTAKNGPKTQLGVRGGSTDGSIELDKATVEEEARLAHARAAGVTDEGALDPVFNRSFKLLVKRQKPDVVIIMEPRIDGPDLDTFIRRSGFEFSFRVEAHGFSGGIWLLWQDSVSIQVLAVSNQFIHTLCSVHDGSGSFFGSFVYASPNSLRRQFLWEQLLALNPGHEHVWVVGGDRNVIGSSSERRGGSNRRLGVCSRFTDFMLESGLIDMGFSGPQFTWQRERRKSRLIDHLKGIERALESNFRPSLIHLEERWKDEMNTALDQEESLLHQKSRTDWISQGDRNTSYYHMAAAMRRKQNGVRMLRIEDGSWCNEPSLLQRHADCINWDIRDGRNTDFWYNHWIGKEERLVFACLSLETPRPSRVADWVTGNGAWDWVQFQNLLPTDSLEWIASIRPPSFDLGGDKPVWRWEDTRMFSTRSAYDFLTQEVPSEFLGSWKEIWTFAIPQRIRVFMWLVFHEPMLTNVERVRCYIATSVFCEICGGDREDIEHVLRSCLIAKRLWLRFIPLESRTEFFSLPFHAWLCKNLFDLSFMCNDNEWVNRFAIMCWLLWKRQCRLVLASEVGVLDDVFVYGNRLTMECSRARVRVREICSGRSLVRHWIRPQARWVKMNVDAVVSIADHTAGVGGVLRDSCGTWLFGFARFVGRCAALIAELWAIHDVRIVNSRSAEVTGSNLVESIRRLVSKDWEMVVVHIGRELNRVADLLAKRGRRLSIEPDGFPLASTDIAKLVDEEKWVGLSISGTPCGGDLVSAGESAGVGDVKSGTRLGFRSGHFRSGKIGYRSIQVDLTFRLESGRVQVRFRSGSFQVGSVSGRVHFRSGPFQVGFVSGRVISDFRSGSFQVGFISGRFHFRSGPFQVGFISEEVIFKLKYLALRVRFKVKKFWSLKKINKED